MTSAERHNEAIEIFLEVCELPEDDRASFLDGACSGDVELRDEVESLLRYDSKVGGVVEAAEAGEGIRALSLIALRESEAVPTRIGDFRIIRRIGHGGMGVVYEAEQVHPHRTVALKVLHAGIDTAELLRRFRREVDLLGRFQHPAIARVYEAGIGQVESESGLSGQVPYFVMELVDGQPLDRFAEARALDDRARLALFVSICDGVQHAHDRGVIHRDLKPANILVTPSAEPKILDFGISRATDADVNTVSMRTSTGQLVGTIPYMSPEQVVGDAEALDGRSDVYSLGVVLFELLAGRLPHELKNRPIPEAVRIIREDEPTILGSVHKRLRGDLETIVSKALEKDRKRRYASAADLAADVRRYLRDDPIVARRASAAYQLRKFTHRHRGVAAGAFIAALALVGGSAVAVRQGLEARAAQRVAEQRFADLHGFAKSVIIDYPRIQDFEGDTRAREFLSQTSLRYLDGMARDTRGLDLRVLEDLAIAYGKTGDALGRPNGPNLGDKDAAFKSYEKSIAVFEDLVARAPDDWNFQRHLAISYERLGNLLLQDQKYQQALEIFRKAHALKEAVAELHPNGRRDLSFSYNKLGDVFVRMGRTDEAYEMFAKSLEIRKQLAEADPADSEMQRGYTVGLNRVADVLLELGRTEDAIANYEASLQRRVANADAQPDNPSATMDLAVGHFKYAHVLARIDRLDDALGHFTTARAILRGMADADPANTTVCAGAAEVSGEMGKILLSAGRAQRALPELTAYTVETERCVPVEKMTADMREQLASGHRSRGQALLAVARSGTGSPGNTGRFAADACDALRRSKVLYESLEDDGARVPQQLLAELAGCEISARTP